jgi:hypothetical protein
MYTQIHLVFMWGTLASLNIDVETPPTMDYVINLQEEY